MNRHTLHALAQQYSMSARLLTPTWRFIVRLEIGGGWYWLYRGGEHRSACCHRSVWPVGGSGALRITGRRVGDVRLLKTISGRGTGGENSNLSAF
jgi:hypothetical protein